MTGTGDGPIVIREESDNETDGGDLNMIPSDESDEAEADGRLPGRTKRPKLELGSQQKVQEDDKKKLSFKTTYDGFSIWGWVLCLLVIRKGASGSISGGSEHTAQALMEEWITSTQPQQDEDV